MAIKTFTHVSDIDFGRNQLFHWRPTEFGDYTLRVHRIVAPVASTGDGPEPTYEALLVQSGVKQMPLFAVIPRPERPGQLYTPQRWVEMALIPAWWPLVRPLLAVLGWASPLHNELGYRAADLRDIIAFARRATGVRA